MASIVVPVFNRYDLTKKFIESTLPYVTDNDELIIVNNASTDDTLTKIFEDFPNRNVTVFTSEKNVGFGEGNNLGANVAHGDVLIFISNDVLVNGDFIRPTEQAILSRGRAFLGHRVIDWPTGWNDVWDVNKEIGPISYPQGYYIALRRSAFWLVGGFDRHMFIDYEDVDLSFRLQQAGYELFGLPELPINHDSSGNTFSQLSEARMQFTLDSMKRFGDKYGFKKVK